MADDEKKRQAGNWLHWLWILPVFYALSGPPLWMFLRDVCGFSEPPAAVMWFYAPLNWLGMYSGWVRAFYDWYRNVIGLRP
jgi:hypothetical protein